jgi:hypothetical protein
MGEKMELVTGLPLDYFINGIKEQLEKLKQEKEINEYKFNKMREKVDEIKSKYFKELLVFERMKEHNPSLNPDFKVLSQMKELETDEMYKKIKQQMDYLKSEIKRIDKEIKKIEKQKNELFKCKNPSVYHNILKKITKGYSTIDELEMVINELAKEIANRELGMITLAPYLKWYVPDDYFEYLIKKCPKDYQPIMRDIYDLFILFHDEFFLYYFKKYPNDKIEDYINEIILRASKDLEKIKNGSK